MGADPGSCGVRRSQELVLDRGASQRELVTFLRGLPGGGLRAHLPYRRGSSGPLVPASLALQIPSKMALTEGAERNIHGEKAQV